MSKWGNGYDEIGWNSPDWDNAVNITNENKPYTVSQDGWISALLIGSTNVDSKLEINGITLYATPGNALMATTVESFVKVSKNDIINWVSKENPNFGATTKIYFVPHK